MYDVILARYGEIFLKKGNRGRFLKQLRRNMEQALDAAGTDRSVRVEFFHGRFAIRRKDLPLSKEETDFLLKALGKVFGLVSLSPARRVELELEAIRTTAHQLMREVVEERKVSTFRVTASRPFKQFPLNSPELNRNVGASLVSEFGLPVSLGHPDVNIGVELYQHGAYVFAKEVAAPGGIPVGSSGSALLLLSGGIDSPVAGWMLAKRGCRLKAIHFHSYPYTSKRSLDKVHELAAELAGWAGPILLISVRLTDIQEFLREKAPRDQLVLFYRRSMVRLASRMAGKLHSDTLVTGESVAQVASQTLANIKVIEDASSTLILRPLIGMDKEETVRLARRIGTYDISIKPYEDCCTLFLPAHPETRGRLDLIKKAEDGLMEELSRLEEAALETKEEFWIGK